MVGDAVSEAGLSLLLESASTCSQPSQADRVLSTPLSKIESENDSRILMPNQELHNHSEVKNLQSPDIQEFVSEKLGELRKRLLDLSRRNPLINIQFRPTSTSILRVVDELPDVLRFNLANGSPMRLAPLPALEEELPDEQTDEFLDSLYIAREEDEQYLAEIATVDTSSDGAEEKLWLNSRIVGANGKLSPIRAGGREDGSRAVSTSGSRMLMS